MNVPLAFSPVLLMDGFVSNAAVLNTQTKYSRELQSINNSSGAEEDRFVFVNSLLFTFALRDGVIETH